MNILVKEIDRLKSTTHINRVLSEYIIYLMIGNQPIYAFTEIGTVSRDQRINFLKAKNNINNITFEG